LSEVETKKRFFLFKNRWLVVLWIMGSFWAINTYGGVIQPHVQLPAEVVVETNWNMFWSNSPLFTFQLTNTVIALLIADVLIFLAAFSFYRYSKKEGALPSGISGALEALLEGLYNMTKETAGKWTKYIFPVFATITLSVLVWNWTELIPGVDSIGYVHQTEHGNVIIENEKFLGMNAIVMAEEDDHAVVEELADDAVLHTEDTDAEVEHEGIGTVEEGHIEYGEPIYGVIPFVRVASTDLNFTLALAVIAVVAVQWMGLKALGKGYLVKFFNTGSLFTVPIFGVIDFAVGLLELIGEFAKILSFSFRLFGNIFAGSVLLFVIGTLVPYAVQTGFLMLEFFVGLIQAIVFGMLVMVFMSQATISHAHDEER
jgi:F-type H+-transporting ATPase subunit a